MDGDREDDGPGEDDERDVDDVDDERNVDDERDVDDEGDAPLPDPVVDEAERLTRLAREAADDGEAAAYRRDRDDVLADHGYTARVRADDEGDVLVLHPAEWVEDGTIRVERVDDLERGVEIPLEGAGDAGDWEEIEAHNRALAEAVAETHGDPHGATAHALADFAGNHYEKSIEDLSAAELREFREEYLPRNAWPTDAQREHLDESIRRTFDAAGGAEPGERETRDERECPDGDESRRNRE